jgi:hypothetical protein
MILARPSKAPQSYVTLRWPTKKKLAGHLPKLLEEAAGLARG